MAQIARGALNSPEERRAFRKTAFALTLPIALQHLMDAAVSSADVAMLSFVSQTAISGASLAGQIQFVLGTVFFGLCSGTTVLCAQYWGKGDTDTIERVMGLTLRLAMTIGLAVSLAALFIPEWLMRIFTGNGPIIVAGAEYLRYVALSYFLNAFAAVYLAVIRTVERVKMSAVVHSGAVLLNIILNALLIFGIGSFPRMGIAGAALATTITRAIEVMICVFDARTNGIARLKIENLLRRDKQLMRDFLRYALPTMGNEFVWSLGFSMYSVILGHLNPDVVAANSVTSVVRNLGTVVCFGVAGSAAIIMGKALGANRIREAEVYAGRLVRLSLYTAAAGTALILAIRPFVMAGMDLTDQAREYLGIMLLISAYYIFGVSFNTMCICGIFRSGGDVKFGLRMDLTCMWGYGVLFGMLAAFVFKLPPMWVYFVLMLDEFVKMPIHHYKGKVWLRNITR